jgi:tetratricopeptide (TPR) repeat protein
VSMVWDLMSHLAYCTLVAFGKPSATEARVRMMMLWPLSDKSLERAVPIKPVPPVMRTVAILGVEVSIFIVSHLKTPIMYIGSYRRGFSVLLPMFVFLLLASCREKTSPSKEMITALNLKRGQLISCGSTDTKFGSVEFATSCGAEVKEDFNLGIKLLHSFEYDEAEKVFAKIVDEEPGCAMAYWGIAMSNFHALWAPPTEPELKKGAKAVEIAQSIKGKSAKEEDYINSIAAFYKDLDKTDHRTRMLRFEEAMNALYEKYPSDYDASAFYALSLTAAADPNDKTFAKQKKAGAILDKLFERSPDHPGIVHYIIHTYDSPELASLGLTAARKYASVAPSSAHALHMPSHIFTRLGLWDECINSNLTSVSSAQCYAESAGLKGHWDEELHGLDYLMYGYLQKGENDLAKRQLDYLASINEVSPVNFKVAYAFASIPARYVLENKDWEQASGLKFDDKVVAWKNYPWQKGIIHFARLMGSVNTGNLTAANAELKALNSIHDELLSQKDAYKANQVKIQATTGEAWLRLKEGKKDEALKLMNLAADMEDKTEKHPVTPGEVIPARELLGDMYMQMNDAGNALTAYEEDLKRHNNRFNGLCGAAMAAEKAGDMAKAKSYYNQLLSFVNPANNQREELISARQFLAKL